MFMSVPYSSKVILLQTLGRSLTTFGLIYGSFDKVWGDNQGKIPQERAHQCSSIMDHD
jgi:hypothetical protein